ncbi:MAG: hypothetical protein J3K34DRAFT_527246 [Monoraphidium minutum]|nr:MAG: hypothetical protein J3K34DRAFT_527246 [Monoraphidium minutum]
MAIMKTAAVMLLLVGCASAARTLRSVGDDGSINIGEQTGPITIKGQDGFLVEMSAEPPAQMNGWVYPLKWSRKMSDPMLIEYDNGVRIEPPTANAGASFSYAGPTVVVNGKTRVAPRPVAVIGNAVPMQGVPGLAGPAGAAAAAAAPVAAAPAAAAAAAAAAPAAEPGRAAAAEAKAAEEAPVEEEPAAEEEEEEEFVPDIEFVEADTGIALDN